jgi:hypothetical protein
MAMLVFAGGAAYFRTVRVFADVAWGRTLMLSRITNPRQDTARSAGVVATWLAVEGSVSAMAGRLRSPKPKDFSRQIMSLFAARSHRPRPASPRWTSGSQPANFLSADRVSRFDPAGEADFHDRRSCAADAVSRPER